MRNRHAAELSRGAIGLIVFFAVVEICVTVSGLPHIPDIARAFLSGWKTGPLAHDLAVSGARWITGWILGALIGVTLGLGTGRITAVRFFLEWPLVLCRALPFIGLLPLSIRLFGLSEAGKILLVTWSVAGTCWLVVHQSARSIPEEVLWRCTSLGIKPMRRLFSIIVPMCAQGIYTGLRASLSLGIIVIAVAELGGVYDRSSGLWWSEGLGYRLFRCLEEARDDLLLATILTFAIVGVIADVAFSTCWHASVQFYNWVAGRKVLKKIELVSRLHVDTPELDIPLPSELHVSNLSAGYNGQFVLERLTFSVPTGNTLVILAPSGSGKTTLLRAIGGLKDKSFQSIGQVTFGTVGLSFPNNRVGLVLQESPVFGHLTVWDNLAIGDQVRAMDSDARNRYVWSFLCKFGLQQVAERKSTQISVGQRQRLSLATALANHPTCILLDEPFSSLDYLRRKQFQIFYREIAKSVTSVFVTHDLSEALHVGDLVRVGLQADAPVLSIDRGDLPYEAWEDSVDFRITRQKLLKILELTS